MRLNSKTYVAIRSSTTLSPSSRVELINWFSPFSENSFEIILVFRIRDDVDIWHLIEEFCAHFPKLLKEVSLGVSKVLESSEMELGSHTQVFYSDGVAKSRLLSRLVDLGGVCLMHNMPPKNQKYRTLTHRGEILLEYQMATTRKISVQKSVQVHPLRFEEELPLLFDHLTQNKGRILYGEGGFGKSERASSFAEIWRVHYKGQVIWVDGRRHQGLDGVVSEIGRCLEVPVASTIETKLRFYDNILIVVVFCQQSEKVISWLDALSNARYLVTTEEVVDHPTAMRVGEIDDYRIRLALQYYNLDLLPHELDLLVPHTRGNLRLAHWLSLHVKNFGLEAALELDAGDSIAASENVHLESLWSTFSPHVKDVLKLMDICIGGMPIEIAKKLFSKDEWIEIAGVKEGQFRGDFFLRLHSESRVQLLPHASRFLNEVQKYSREEYLDEYCQVFSAWIQTKLDRIDSAADTPALIALRDEVLNFGPIIDHGSLKGIELVSRAIEITSRRLGPVSNQADFVRRISEYSQNEALRLLLVHQNIRSRHLSEAIDLIDKGDFVEYKSESERIKALVLLRQNKPDLGLEHAVNALRLSTPEWRDECRLRKVEVLMRLGRDKEAHRLVTKVFETAQSQNTIARVHFFLGQLLTERGELEKGRPYLLRAIDYYQEVGGVRDLVEPFLILGISAFHRGKIEEGSAWFEDAEVSALSSGIVPFLRRVKSEKAYHFAAIGDLVAARHELHTLNGESELTIARRLKLDAASVLIACDEMNFERAKKLVDTWDLHVLDSSSIDWVIARVLKTYVSNHVLVQSEPLVSVELPQTLVGHVKFLETQLLRRDQNRERKEIRLSEDAALVNFDGNTIQLGRRLALRRIVLELAKRSNDRLAMSVDETFTIGWLDEVATQSSRKRRVYSAINRLKDLGIPVTRISEGYLLDGYHVVFT